MQISLHQDRRSRRPTRPALLARATRPVRLERLEDRRLLSTTYYVSNGGSDANAGTSSGLPWASVAKVNATAFQPGDQILFQRGGEWHAQLEASSDGTAANRITYGDYGDAALARPTFDGSDNVPATAFTALGNSVYTFSTANTNDVAYWVYLNHVSLLAATSGGTAMPANSFFVSGSTVYVNTNGVDPRVSTNVVSVGDRATGQNVDQGVISSNGHSYVTFQNMVGRETAQVPGDGKLAGGLVDAYVVRVQGGAGVTLSNLEADYGGKHNVGAIDTTGFVASGVVAQGGANGVAGNTLGYGNATAFVAYADQNFHKTTQTWADCTVQNYFGDQPAFLTHNDGSDSLASLTIDDLKSYGSPVALQPGTNVRITYTGGLITNNNLTAYTSTGTTELFDGVSLTGAYPYLQVNGNATVQNCLITGSNQPAVQVTGPNNVIRFNTILPQGYATAIDLRNGSTNDTVYGNLIANTGHSMSIAGGVTYTADYDFFDTSNGNGAPTFTVAGTDQSLATFQAGGHETHGVTGAAGFTNRNGGDYSLLSSSAAINVVPTSYVSPAVATDLRGFARPSANVYDAGAYEYQSVLHQPTVATAAAATPSPVAGKTTALSVLGASQDGEGTLTYTWATTGTPPAAVAFSDNGTNGAKNTTASFAKAGTYDFVVTIGNGQYATTSGVSVTVNATATALAVRPADAYVPVNTTQQFTATVTDQFGYALSGVPITWSVANGGGTISSTGLYTAGSTAGAARIQATGAGLTGTDAITVTPPNQAPTVATAASATPNPVTSTTTALSVLGADDNGESNLTYGWSLAGTPPAAVSYSANGTNAAKNTTATFTANGRYNFVVTITDSGGLSTTSAVSVTVNTIVPVVVDGNLDGVYGKPIAVQTQATNYGNGNLGSPSAPYSQLSAGYAVIDPANGVLDVFLAGSLNLNNAHLDLLIDSVPNAGVANLSSLYGVNPYGTGGFSTIKFDAGFRPDHIFTQTYGGGYSLNYVNLDTGATAQNNLTDPATGLATSGGGIPYFQERVNDAAQSGVVVANAGGGVTTGAEYAFKLSDLGYTAANFTAGVPINIAAMISYGSHTEGTNQILAPYTPNSAELTKDGGVYTYFGNGNFDFSNNTRFAGNQYFAVAPPATPNQAPTIATAPSANPNPVAGKTTTLNVLGADDGGEANLTYTWSLSGTPPAPVAFSVNGTNAAKTTVATFAKTGTYNFLVTVSDGSLTTVSSVTVTVSAVTPDVKSFVVNDGSVQRSMVRTLTVAFTVPVTLDAGAITLTNTTTNTAVSFTAATADGGTTYVLTPTSGREYSSLADGVYSLVVHPAGVHSAADASAVMTGSDRTYSFFRLAEDGNGDGSVTIADFNGLAASFNLSAGQAGYAAAYDSNDDNAVTIADFNALASRFNRTITAAGHAVVAHPLAMPSLGSGSLNGNAFKDHDSDGKYDAGDGVATGVTVFLDTNNNGRLDADERTVVTDARGRFTFRNLPTGTYHVRRVVPVGQKTTTAAITVKLTGRQDKNGLRIGTA